MSKNIAVFTQSFLTAIPSNIVDEIGFVCDLTDEIEKLIQKKFAGVTLQSTSFNIYSPNLDNLSHCQKCGAWTTNSENENFIHEINLGAFIDGRLLCNQCLSNEHTNAL